MRKRIPDSQKGSSLLSVMLISLSIVLYFFVFTWLLIFLIVFAGRMPKWLYFTLLFLYLTLLASTGGYLYRRIELRKERALYGDEAFFAAHPKEWKRELRRWRRAGAHRTAANEESEEGPAVLSGTNGNAAEPKKAYDELYYGMYPNVLKRDLARQRFFRRIRERLTHTSKEPSVYEKRLAELKEKLGIE